MANFPKWQSIVAINYFDPGNKTRGNPRIDIYSDGDARTELSGPRDAERIEAIRARVSKDQAFERYLFLWVNKSKFISAHIATRELPARLCFRTNKNPIDVTDELVQIISRRASI